MRLILVAADGPSRAIAAPAVSTAVQYQRGSVTIEPQSRTPIDDPLVTRLADALGPHYRLGPEVGRGGMGVVYRATDTRLQRDIAIKVLPPELSFRDDLRERFLRESRMAGGLSHPHIVPIHDVGEGNGLVWYMMAFVDGESVRSRVERDGALTSAQTRRIIREVAWALSYAHARGIVHRDIKPDNILLERGTGRALVTDFGIAKIAEGDSTASGTTPGMIMGSLMYMAPEQATGEGQIDQRADIYSLGLSGYFMLGGKPPFERATVVTVAARIATGKTPSWEALDSSVDHGLRELLERCANPIPDQRWDTAEQILEALGPQAVAPRPMPAQIRRLVRDFMLVPTLGMIVLVVDIVAESPSAGEFIAWMAVILLVNLYVTLRKFTERGFDWPDLREALDMEIARQAEELEQTAALRERFSAIIHLAFWAGISTSLVSFAALRELEPIVPIALGMVAIAGLIQYPLAWLAIQLYSYLGRLALKLLPSMPRPEAKGWFSRFVNRVLGRLFTPLGAAAENQLPRGEAWGVPDIASARRSAMSIDEAFETLPRKLRDDLRSARQLARDLTQTVGNFRTERATLQRQLERELDTMGVQSRQASSVLEQIRGSLEALAEGRGTKSAVEQALGRGSKVIEELKEETPSPKGRRTAGGWFGVRLDASVTGSSPYKEEREGQEDGESRVRELAQAVEARWQSLDLDRDIPGATARITSLLGHLDRLEQNRSGRHSGQAGLASAGSVTQCERLLVDLKDALARLDENPGQTRELERLLTRAAEVEQDIDRALASEQESA